MKQEIKFTENLSTIPDPVIVDTPFTLLYSPNEYINVNDNYSLIDKNRNTISTFEPNEVLTTIDSTLDINKSFLSNVTNNTNTDILFEETLFNDGEENRFKGMQQVLRKMKKLSFKCRNYDGNGIQWGSEIRTCPDFKQSGL